MLEHRTHREVQEVASGLFVLVGPDAAAEHLIAMFGWDPAFQALAALRHDRAGEATYAAVRQLTQPPEAPANPESSSDQRP